MDWVSSHTVEVAMAKVVPIREQPKTGSTNRIYAGVDLGSNSFHMVIARADDGGALTFIDRRKEYVRMAGGLLPDGSLSEEAIQRAEDCLSRLGERLRNIPASRVRVVGTNTFRKARNGRLVLQRLESALGHRIDIISGLEEARLVYRGVALQCDELGRRLVIDIGGGSTEIVLGNGPEILDLDSHYLGCVSWTLKYFADGRMTRDRFHEATLAARRQLRSGHGKYRDRFDHAVGSSGTMKAVERTLLQLGYCNNGITLDGICRLEEHLETFGHVDKITFPEMSRERAKVFPGGLAIVHALMESFHIPELRSVSTALREGVLVDLQGREHNADVRTRTIQRLMTRFEVDRTHAKRVGDRAMAFFDQVAEDWGIPVRPYRRLLRWAAQLHEVGLFMGFTGYHKHGAYLLANSDLPGFSMQEQRSLAALVLGHRGRFSIERLQAVSPQKRVSIKLVALLRLAHRLHRNRTDQSPLSVSIQVLDDALQLTFPPGWLDEHPLTQADLATEKRRAGLAGLEIVLL